MRDKYRIGKQLTTFVTSVIHECFNKFTSKKCTLIVLDKFSVMGFDKLKLAIKLICEQDCNISCIPMVYDYFEDDQRFYIVTEVIRGRQLLDEILERGSLTEIDVAMLTYTLL